MSVVKILSVAEDDGRSDRISCILSNDNMFMRDSTRKQDIRLSINGDNDMVINISEIKDGSKVRYIFNAPDIDIDGLIGFLNDAKEFISEDRMMKKLIGK